ncbi:hypothetical protein ACKGJO_02720 [Gracilimonas sp. Q87]|uniref:hypothetical protein n=1 Tax=Gracilimonas sp. Q87 TaxID=3384766 RepID=UPI00398455CB
MENLGMLFVFTLVTLTSCGVNEAEQMDSLEQTDILGEWKLDSRSVNGISDLSIQCCDYIEFKTDDDPSDLKGEFRSYGVGYETNGLFELKDSDKTIQFVYNDVQRAYEFQLSDDRLTFTYPEDDSEIIEYWRKL